MSASNSFSYTNRTAISSSLPDSHQSTPSPMHFAQETGNGNPSSSHSTTPTCHLAPPTNASLVHVVPGKGGERPTGQHGSIRSVPDETINASNRVACGGTHFHTFSDSSIVYHQSQV